jgi:hypothetical protein
LAAWGRYPIVVAQALKKQGYFVCCIGVKDHADPVLAKICDDFQWSGLSKLGRGMRYFRRHRVTDATMAGKFHKTLLYQPWMLLKHLPDWQAFKTFYPYFATTRKDRRDDTLLGVVVDAFAEIGIRFGPATDYAPELLVKQGLLTSRRLSDTQQADIRFGWNLAKEMGRLDVGQSVCVKGQSIIAVEAIEGTDQCIRRAGELCPAGNFTIVKVAKPQQDMRFDVPTIGLETLKTMVQSKARVLAVEAQRTILLDEAEFIRFADRNKLVVVAMDPQTFAQKAA